MRHSGGVVLGIAASLVLGGCAAAGPKGPVVSPTGIVYPLGTYPVETRFSQTAALYLRQDKVERALDVAREGVESDPVQAIHYALAGTAYARLGERVPVQAIFRHPERIAPA